MKRALAFLATAGITVTPASAQRVVAGAHFAFGDYREVSRALVYGATGIGGTLAVSWGRFGGDLEVAALEYEEDDGTLTPFKATQLDGRLRYRVYRGLSVEAGFTNRKSDDEFLGQSVGAIRLGAHAAVGLGPAAGATVRYNFLTGSKFSGGGSAGLGLEAGVGVFYGFANGRFRLTGAYDYQRFNRTIDTGGTDEDVPIQQVLARIGAAVSF
jgi:hypothetical protein